VNKHFMLHLSIFPSQTCDILPLLFRHANVTVTNMEIGIEL
jgi:hypothetical protein